MTSSKPRADAQSPDDRQRTRRVLIAALVNAVALVILMHPLRALAGPPFQTDDPEPVDLGHYEFYIFSGSVSRIWTWGGKPESGASAAPTVAELYAEMHGPRTRP